MENHPRERILTADSHKPHVILASHWHRHQVRALILQAKKSMMGEVRSVSPVLEIGRGKDSNNKFLRVCKYHDPVIFEPDDFWVTELS